MPSSRRRSTPGPRRLDPTLDFMQLLWAIEHGLNKMSKRMNRELGLTGPQRLVLRIASRFPGLSAGDLARIVQLHPSTITGVLHRLVTRRLLRRERDPDDSRRTRLWPTAKAGRFTRRSNGTVEEIVGRALRTSQARDVLAARTVLAELARTLNESTAAARHDSAIRD